MCADVPTCAFLCVWTQKKVRSIAEPHPIDTFGNLSLYQISECILKHQLRLKVSDYFRRHVLTFLLQM